MMAKPEYMLVYMYLKNYRKSDSSSFLDDPNEGSEQRLTLLCLSFGTHKNDKFSICSKWKIIFICPEIWVHYGLIIMCSNIGTLKTINFPFGTNGKLIVLGVPILKHFRV